MPGSSLFCMKMADKFKDITDDELIEEVRDRNLESNFNINYAEEIEKMEEETDKCYKRSNHVLPMDFDRFQLRDHLCNITRLGSYVSDEKLFNTLGFLLEFS